MFFGPRVSVAVGAAALFALLARRRHQANERRAVKSAEGGEPHTADLGRCILCSHDVMQRSTFVQDRAFRYLVQFNASSAGHGLGGEENESHSAKRRSGPKAAAHHRLGGPTQRGKSSSAAGAPGAGGRFMELFTSDSLLDRLARALARVQAIDMKEFCESVEFFARVRKHVKNSAHVADLCCGHGFTGMLFAVFEKSAQRVFLLDRVRPPAFESIFAAVCEVAPWCREKVRMASQRSAPAEWR